MIQFKGIKKIGLQDFLILGTDQKEIKIPIDKNTCRIIATYTQHHFGPFIVEPPEKDESESE